MATDKQIAANRENAKKSTGPRTESGKTRSSRNATSHGLTARHFTIDGESPDRFNRMHARMIAEFEPRNEDELALIETMAVARWRLRRIWGMEQATVQKEMAHQQDVNPDFANQSPAFRAALAFRTICDSTGFVETLSRHETRLNREYIRVRQELLKRAESRKQTQL